MALKLTFDKLSTKNYGTWHVQMEAFLVVNECAEAITDAAHAKSGKAKALIILGIEGMHVSQVNGCSNAKEAWDALKNTYQAQSKAQEMQLRQQLSTLSMEHNEIVTNYFARARTIRDQLAEAGGAIADKDVVMAVMNGFPPLYDVMTTAFKCLDIIPSLDKLQADALQVEQRARVTNACCERERVLHTQQVQQHEHIWRSQQICGQIRWLWQHVQEARDQELQLLPP
jgi:hypothetical protein